MGILGFDFWSVTFACSFRIRCENSPQNRTFTMEQILEKYANEMSAVMFFSF